MRVAPGRAGALHAVALYLARNRQAAGARLDWAARSADEVQREALVFREADVTEVLLELNALGVIERAEDATWRATEMAVTAIQEAYADRHPLVED